MKEDERKKEPKPILPPFSEVNVPGARSRDKRGQYSGIGTPVESDEVKGVRRAAKIRDYRKFLESIEPTAMKVLAEALRDKRVGIKEKLLVAQDVLNRLHGKALVPQEAEEARRKVENMSTDELVSFVTDLAGEMGLAVKPKSSQVVN